MGDAELKASIITYYKGLLGLTERKKLIWYGEKPKPRFPKKYKTKKLLKLHKRKIEKNHPDMMDYQ